MKKITTIIISLIIVNIMSVAFANSILYKKANITQISTGTYLTEYRILTEDGWVNANVITIDTGDEYNKIGLLTNVSGDRYLGTIYKMTNNNNAIVGINADFFAGRNGIGHAIGLAIDDGLVASSPTWLNNEKDGYASFLMDYDNDVFYEYVSSRITLKFTNDDYEINIRDINKYSDDYSLASVFNRKFGEYSIGSSEDLDLIEFVVNNGKIIDVRQNEEKCEIPENGYVVSILTKDAQPFINYIKVGKKVELDMNYTPNIKNIKFAVSGGAKLIDNGVIPDEFSHNVSGRNPRTAIGTNKKENTIYLVAIDGRIKSSIGMTQQEEAEFLLSIGVYNAINLDGGGSTTMVAKKLGDTELSEINTLSEGSERKVTNGVGIFNSAPESSKLDKLIIEVRDTNILKGEDRKITVKGYNKYMQGVEIDENDIKWDYDGVEVSVKNGYVSGSTSGKTTLIAKIGKAKGEIELNILDNVNEIYVYPKEKYINPGESVSYTVKAKDKNGNYAITMLNSYDLSIYEYYLDNELQNDIPKNARFEDLTFYTDKAGIYILKISKGDCTTFSKVIVGSQNFVLIDDFEKQDFTFDPYPDEVGGSATLSDVQSYDGKNSALLKYDFDVESKVRGAYIVFDEEKVVPIDATKLAFWVYNDEYKDEQLKIKVIDGNDQTKIIVAQDNILHDGWGEIEVDLSSYALPLRITDIYLAQHDENIKTSGFIYVDKLGYYSKNSSSKSMIKIPNDIKNDLDDEIDISSENSFNIAFLDGIDDSKMMINWLKNNMIAQNINKNCKLTVFTNKISENVKKMYLSQYNGLKDYNEKIESENDEKKRFVAYVSKINTEYLENIKYGKYENEYCTIINLDISQNSIRKTDSTQYAKLQEDVKKDKTNNIILILNESIDKFSDINERMAFLDILKELSLEKNIIVVHKGFNSNYSMEYGIRFLGINSENVAYTDIENHKILKISINKNIMSYKYEGIYKK